MNEQTKKSIAYSMNFITFLFLDKSVKDRIISIYLFGSSVRGEMDKDSDIDIFINCKKQDEETILKSCMLAESMFRKSKDFEKWERLGFVFPISVKTGPIEEWQLKTSIESEGIQLYSRTPLPNDLDRYVIFSIEYPKMKKDYLKIYRILFGRDEKHYSTKGLVEQIGGKKLGSNVFIIPKSEQTRIIDILHKRKIRFSMEELLKTQYKKKLEKS